MKKNTLTKWILICFMSIVLSTAQGSTVTHKLHLLIHKIYNLQTKLHKTQKKRLSIKDQLKTTNISIALATRKMQHTQIELNREQMILKKLRDKKLAYQQQVEKQQKILSAQIRSAYILGQQPYLKLLLNHQNPSTFSRTFIYYKYLNDSRLQIIKKLEANINNLKQTEAKIKQHANMLTALKKQQQKSHIQLVYDKHNRLHLLRIIDHRINAQRHDLRHLYANKHALEKVINRLKVLAQTSKLGESLSRLKHRLRWPTNGHLENHYGQHVQGSQITWNGVLIFSKEDNKIHAIAPGKVIFANRLHGYGLLLIINHGHGYMSLYGYNHNLYKKTGDHVRAGDTIASVGTSGDNIKPALYFAIRYNGHPVNPTIWCMKS